MFKKSLIAGAIVTATFAFASSAFAIGGASGPKVTYPVKGKLGAVIMNPYKIAPLTAVIRNGGYVVTDVSVRIVPKENGQEIAYKVSDKQVRTHGGIPVFGLYPDYVNSVEVSYTRTNHGKSERVEKEVYKIYAQPFSLEQPRWAALLNGTTVHKTPSSIPRVKFVGTWIRMPFTMRPISTRPAS